MLLQARRAFVMSMGAAPIAAVGMLDRPLRLTLPAAPSASDRSASATGMPTSSPSTATPPTGRSSASASPMPA